jgi:hypothetical protein
MMNVAGEPGMLKVKGNWVEEEIITYYLYIFINT